METGWTGDGPARLNALFAEALPEVNWTEDRYQGYVRVEFTQTDAQVDFVAVDTYLSRDYRVSRLRRTVIRKQDGGLMLEAEG